MMVSETEKLKLVIEVYKKLSEVPEPLRALLKPLVDEMPGLLDYCEGLRARITELEATLATRPDGGDSLREALEYALGVIQTYQAGGRPYDDNQTIRARIMAALAAKDGG